MKAIALVPPAIAFGSWEFILDWGYTSELWGKSGDRVLIDRDTGKVIIRYKFKGG